MAMDVGLSYRPLGRDWGHHHSLCAATMDSIIHDEGRSNLSRLVPQESIYGSVVHWDCRQRCGELL